MGNGAGIEERQTGSWRRRGAPTELTAHEGSGTLEWMPRAYFDTTVYDHIAKGAIPAQDVDALRPLVARGKIMVYPSVAGIDELLGQWETEPAEAVRRLQILYDLVGFDTMLKQPADLLADAILAYAAGTASPPRTLRGPEREILAAYLDRILRGDASLRTRQP